MFRDYINIAIAKFNLVVDGPLLIKSGQSNKIDPTLPDQSFVRGLYNGENTLVIPGSSIKGVIRSRAHTINYKTTKGIFGDAMTHKSKISFHDAYANPESVVTSIRYNIAIDKYTQYTTKGSLRTMEVVEEGIFKAGFKLINYQEQELDLILGVLNDVNTGLVRFGGNKSRGFGIMKVKEFHITMSDGFDKDLKVKNERSFSTMDIESMR